MSFSHSVQLLRPNPVLNMSSSVAASAAAAHLLHPSLLPLGLTQTQSRSRQRDSRRPRSSSDSNNPNNSSNSNGSSNSDNASRSSHQQSADSAHTYGYQQSFHSHAPVQLQAPPAYESAIRERKGLSGQRRSVDVQLEHLPPYTCTVKQEGVMGLSKEFSSPFMISQDLRWYDVYVTLRGTMLCIHRIKNPGLFSKRRISEAGKVLQTFSLQHAEIGVATDFKKTELIPKHPLAHLVPPTARQKLYESDPHLFEPVREHVIRLRLETEQFLLCAETQEQMLDWVEALCAALDISHPLEVRSEPRYRTLPRRSRRQRVLENRLMNELDNLQTNADGRRLVAEQERILRELYPNLAGTPLERTSSSGQTPASGQNDGDPEEADLDRSDVAFPNQQQAAPPTPNETTQAAEPTPSPVEQAAAASSRGDPKIHPLPTPTDSQRLRYRRRCAPILLYGSPRGSDVVLHKGQRMRIDNHELTLKRWELQPPRYESHGFPKATSRLLRATAEAPRPAAHRPALASTTSSTTDLSERRRPAGLSRNPTEDSFAWSEQVETELSLVTVPSRASAEGPNADRADSSSIDSAGDATSPMLRSLSKEEAGHAGATADEAAAVRNALGRKMRRSSDGGMMQLDHAIGGLSLIS